MNDETRTVVLIDDHGMFRQGIRALIEDRFRIVGEGGSSDEAWALVTEHSPDVLLLDVEIPGAPAEQTIKNVAIPMRTLILRSAVEYAVPICGTGLSTPIMLFLHMRSSYRKIPRANSMPC